MDTQRLHPVCTVILIPKPWALICCHISIRSSGKASRKILDAGCRDLLSFSHKSISGVGHWCWTIRPGSQSVFQFIPKVLNGRGWGQGSAPASQVPPHQTENLFFIFFFMDLALCTGELAMLKQLQANCCCKGSSALMAKPWKTTYLSEKNRDNNNSQACNTVQFRHN